MKMKIDLRPYLDRVPKRVGASIYLNHVECPAGEDTRKRLWIIRSDKGYNGYCHHCGGKGFSRSTSSLFKQDTTGFETSQRAVEIPISNNQLPDDYRTQIPPEGLLWLFSYDISTEEIKKYEMGWSQELGMIIFPLKVANVILGWQGRDPITKKYKNSGPGLVFKAYSRNRGKVVLVEDIVSAIKVNRIMSCIALLGTNLKNLDISGDNFIIWLDYDVRDKAQKMANELSLWGKVKVIVTKKDPKYYSTDEIEDILTIND